MNEIDDYWNEKIRPLEDELKQARWFAKNVVAAMAPVLLDAGLGVDAKPSEVIDQIEKMRMDYGRLKADVEAARRFVNARPDLVDPVAQNVELRTVVEAVRLMLISGHTTKEGVTFPRDRVENARNAVKAIDQRKAP